MGRAGRHGRGTAAARLLAVVLGLLAMHGSASTHHPAVVGVLARRLGDATGLPVEAVNASRSGAGRPT